MLQSCFKLLQTVAVLSASEFALVNILANFNSRQGLKREIF